MKDMFAYLRTIGLDIVNGFVFGSLCEIAYQIRFYFLVREFDRIAAEGGPWIDMWYPRQLWTLPSFFMLVFAVASLFMHWLRPKHALSRMRLWQEIGLTSAVVSLLPIYYYWSGFSVGALLFLFGLAFVLNSIFGGFLQMVADSQMRKKSRSSLKEQANTACTRLVGVGAFSGSLRGLKLVPLKWRYRVPPTSG